MNEKMRWPTGKGLPSARNGKIFRSVTMFSEDRYLKLLITLNCSDPDHCSVDLCGSVLHVGVFSHADDLGPGYHFEHLVLPDCPDPRLIQYEFVDGILHVTLAKDASAVRQVDQLPRIPSKMLQAELAQLGVQLKN